MYIIYLISTFFGSSNPGTPTQYRVLWRLLARHDLDLGDILARHGDVFAAKIYSYTEG